MAQPNDSPVFLPVSVIGTQFIAPYTLEVKIEKVSEGNLVITDINNKIILKVKPCDTTFHHQRLLTDANDIPVVMIREKNMSEHNRWKVYRGESKAKEDMIFSTKTEQMIQSKARVNVYLRNKMSNKDDYDFKIEGNWSKRSYAIYMGDSSTAIAQISSTRFTSEFQIDNVNTVHPLHNVKLGKNNFIVTINPNVDLHPIHDVKLGNDNFIVTINPNVDYAFVVALIVIVDVMKSSDPKEVAGKVGAGFGGGPALFPF